MRPSSIPSESAHHRRALEAAFSGELLFEIATEQLSRDATNATVLPDFEPAVAKQCNFGHRRLMFAQLDSKGEKHGYSGDSGPGGCGLGWRCVRLPRI
jgi:hypothetical protein